jgi:hypothetical protein
MATSVTSFQPVQLLAQVARQLPDQSTTLQVESFAPLVIRAFGRALPIGDIA